MILDEISHVLNKGSSLWKRSLRRCRAKPQVGGADEEGYAAGDYQRTVWSRNGPGETPVRSRVPAPAGSSFDVWAGPIGGKVSRRQSGRACMNRIKFGTDGWRAVM